MKNLDPIIPISEEGLYPIRTISELSGVNAITLRAWERRYGLFSPKRTPKGHRLYSDKDIQLIHRVLELLAKGVSIGHVAKALKEEQSKTNFSIIKANNNKTESNDILSLQEWESHQQTLYKLINAYDIYHLETFHHELFSKYGTDEVTKHLIRPVLETLTSRAAQLQSLSGDFHFYKIFLSHRMGSVFLKSSVQNSGKKILLIGVDDQQCDTQILLFSISLLSEGYQVIILGCSIPFDAIPMTLNASNAEGVLLYSDVNTTNKVATHSFTTLVSSIDTPVFVTGKYSELQEKRLMESGVLILPKNRNKQIEMIDQNLNKNTK